jgi:hypothetical protein
VLNEKQLSDYLKLKRKQYSDKEIVISIISMVHAQKINESSAGKIIVNIFGKSAHKVLCKASKQIHDQLLKDILNELSK